MRYRVRAGRGRPSRLGPGPQVRRRRALRYAAPGPLRDYLSVPFPDVSLDAHSARLLAIDLETSAVDPREGELLAVGFVPVEAGRIVLGGARRIIVRPQGGVGQSAAVHGLTDDAVAAGAPLEEAVAEVLEALRGRALLAHFAAIEVGFLSAACERLWGAAMPCLAVDTLEIERRLTTTWSERPRPGSLRLWAARERYRLPPSRAHDALLDAIACAELFLAQVSELGEEGPVPLRRLLA